MEHSLGSAMREARYWQAEAVGPFRLADGTGLETVGYATAHRSPLGVVVCITALAPASVDWWDEDDGDDGDGARDGAAAEARSGRPGGPWQARGPWQWRPLWNIEHRAGSGVLEVLRPWRHGVWRGGPRLGLPSSSGEAEEVLYGDGWTAVAAAARVWGVDVRPVDEEDLDELAVRSGVGRDLLLAHLAGLPALGWSR